MPRIREPQAERGRKFVPIGALEWIQQIDGSADVLFAVEGRDGRPWSCSSASVMNTQVARVFLLDVQAVAKHDGRQVGRSRRAIDRAAKTRAKEAGKIAAVVDVARATG